MFRSRLLYEISSLFFSVKITFKFFHWVWYLIGYHPNITILSDARVEEMSISYEAKVFLTIYYVTLATIGIPGNIMTCFFSFEKSSRKMSATNCFLLNLSIVDLLNLTLGETFDLSFLSSQLKLENQYRILNVFEWIGCKELNTHTMFDFSFDPKVKVLHHNWVPR